MACARGMPMHAMETPLGETNGQRGQVTWVHDQGRRIDANHHASCKRFRGRQPCRETRASGRTLAPRENNAS